MPQKEARWTWRGLAITVRLALPLVASLFVAPRLEAQLLPGSRVRVTVATTTLIGRLEQLSADSVVLTTDAGVRHSYDRPLVQRLEISQGRHTRKLKGALVGLGIGGAAGLLAGLAFDAEADGEDARRYRACRERGDLCLFERRLLDNAEIAIGGIVGGAVGTLAGTIVGAKRVEQWRALPLTTAVQLGAGRIGVRVALQ